MNNILVVVDMQNDFIDGALGTKEAEAIVKPVSDYISGFNGEVIFTRDTHFDNYMETQEGKKLPVPHCIKSTQGWQIRDELEKYINKDTKIFDKLTFGSVELGKYIADQKDVTSVTLLGLCTDICVISNALLIKAALPEVEINVVERCCAGVSPESHMNALEAMKMCQIKII